MKRVAVCVGDGSPRDAEVKPGSTAADLLSQVGLTTDYMLSRHDGLKFGDTEPVYGLVGDGEKLHASTKSEVGR